MYKVLKRKCNYIEKLLLSIFQVEGSLEFVDCYIFACSCATMRCFTCFNILSSVIFLVVHRLSFLEATVVVAEFRLVEGLRFVEVVAVGSSKLIGVKVLLGPPLSAIPELGV